MMSQAVFESCTSVYQSIYLNQAGARIPEYVGYMARRGRKPLSLENMERASRKCCEALDALFPGIRLEDVGDEETAMLQAELLRSFKESTARTYLDRFGSFAEWVTGRNPVKHARLMWNGRADVERVWITAEDYRRLYAVAKPRERLMLALGATMGLRREEIMTLTVGQLRDGGIEIHGKGHGPDGRVEWWPMSDGVRRALEEWAPERERLVRKYGAGCDRLVVSRTGEAMDKGTMDWIMRQLGRRAGVKVTPHSLRRLFATTMNDSGVDLETMARMMRHTSPTTTMTYYLKADPRRMASATEAVDSVLTVRRTPNKYYI
jgi:integrase/recombinase XerD